MKRGGRKRKKGEEKKVRLEREGKERRGEEGGESL